MIAHGHTNISLRQKMNENIYRERKKKKLLMFLTAGDYNMVSRNSGAPFLENWGLPGLILVIFIEN